jgi:hypothetical protein
MVGKTKIELKQNKGKKVNLEYRAVLWVNNVHLREILRLR